MSDEESDKIVVGLATNTRESPLNQQLFYIKLGDRFYPLGGHLLADVRFTQMIASSAIAVSIALDQTIAELMQLRAELRERAELRGDTLYKQVLERYNRAHGQNRRITLKQICEEMGVRYDAVRQYRSRARKGKTKK